MPPSSITFQTESIFWRAEGEVLDRDDYWLIRTPANPTYYGGNLIYFAHPPKDGDSTRWINLFKNEFKGEPNVKHVFMMWDIPGNEIGITIPFVDSGFEVQANVTLMTDEVVQPPRINNRIEVRRIETDRQWDQVLEAKLKDRNPRFDLETYTPFKRKWLEVRRRLADQKRGDWFGAYMDEQMVGDLGLFFDGSVARFQDVGTDAEFRRMGVCGTLVYEVSKSALASGRTEALVMIADESYHAAKIYESVGFRPVERHATACRYPERHRSG